MKKLKGFQRRYLRGIAHSIKPVVFIGQKGVTESIIHSVDVALRRHELIKVKFVDFKEKAQKQEIGSLLEEKTGSEMIGMIGHTGIFYRENEDPEKRKIKVPEKGG